MIHAVLRRCEMSACSFAADLPSDLCHDFVGAPVFTRTSGTVCRDVPAPQAELANPPAFTHNPRDLADRESI
jgi:hypothetical protein